MSEKYQIIYTDKNDASLQVRKSTNFKRSLKISDPDAPATDNQVKYLIKIGYHGKIPRSTGHADFLIKKELGTLKDFPEIEKKYAD